MKRLLLQRLMAALLAAFAVFAVFDTALAETKGEEPIIDAAGAVLMDGMTNKVLYAKTAHEKLPMASTTKIMTAILAIEHGNLDSTVNVPKEAFGTEGSSMYLRLNEKLSLRDLLYGLMLLSGNDAAVAIAIHIGGSIERFASMMNEKAKEIGANNTNFVTPNGLHDDAHYTTAYDLALIAAHAMRNDTFREIVSTTYYRAETGEVIRTFKNKNRLLWEYEGGNGIKTGYTSVAGKCLVFSAERDGTTLIGVVLKCPQMFDAAKALLDYGFGAFSKVKLISSGDSVARVRVEGAKKSTLALCVKEDIMILLKNGDTETLRTRVRVDAPLIAPVDAAIPVGMLEIREDGRLLCQSALYPVENVESAAFSDHLERLFKRWCV